MSVLVIEPTRPHGGAPYCRGQHRSEYRTCAGRNARCRRAAQGDPARQYELGTLTILMACLLHDPSGRSALPLCSAMCHFPEQRRQRDDVADHFTITGGVEPHPNRRPLAPSRHVALYRCNNCASALVPADDRIARPSRGGDRHPIIDPPVSARPPRVWYDVELRAYRNSRMSPVAARVGQIPYNPVMRRTSA